MGLIHALSDKHSSGAVIVIENFDINEIKTAAFVAIMEKFELSGKRNLMVTAEKNSKLILASANVKSFSVKTASDLNALDVMKSSSIIIEKGAIEKLSKRLEVK